MSDLIHFKVTGTVQGVSFRYATQKEANDLGLIGWVRNNQDESVEGAASGSSSKIHDFRTFLSKGPSAASVDNVEYMKDIKGASEVEVKEVLGGDLDKFEVR